MEIEGELIRNLSMSLRIIVLEVNKLTITLQSVIEGLNKILIQRLFPVVGCVAIIFFATLSKFHLSWIFTWTNAVVDLHEFLLLCLLTVYHRDC